MAHDVPDAADRRRPGRVRRAAAGLRSPRWLVLHAGIFTVVNVAFVVVWLLAPDPATVQGLPPAARDQFWPGWTMLLLGIPLGLHATVVLATRPSREPAAPATQRRPEAAAAPPGPAPGGRQPEHAERVLATVLFTDIVGSTERAREVGDRRWGELLDAHDRLAGELVGRFGGGW
jgi:hypothetical protein